MKFFAIILALVTVQAFSATPAAIQRNFFTTGQHNIVMANGTNYTTLDDALRAAPPNSTVTVVGSVTLSNHFQLTNGIFLDLSRGTILNYYTNANTANGIVGLSFGNNTTISGGTITNMGPTNQLASYQACWGVDYRQGDYAPTNFYATGVTLWGNSDCSFFYSSNTTLSGVIENCRYNTTFDAVVAAFNGAVDYNSCRFKSTADYFPPGSANTPTMIALHQGKSTFRNCSFELQTYGSEASLSCAIYSANTGQIGNVRATNLFYNCDITANCTNAALMPIYRSTGATTNFVLFSNTTIDGSAQNYGVYSQGKGTIEFANCRVMPSNGNLQTTNGSATVTMIINGAGNLRAARMATNQGTLTINLWP